jgi:hypothetical protein
LAIGSSLSFKSKRSRNSRSRSPNNIVRRRVEVRIPTSFGSEQLVNIVNESLPVEGRGERRSALPTLPPTTTY